MLPLLRIKSPLLHFKASSPLRRQNSEIGCGFRKRKDNQFLPVFLVPPSGNDPPSRDFQSPANPSQLQRQGIQIVKERTTLVVSNRIELLSQDYRSWALPLS